MDAMRTLAADVTTQLEKLGALGTAEQIRDYFVQEQILGVCRNGQKCPVHNYLQRELSFPELPIGVGIERTQIGLDPLGTISVHNPGPVTSFIVNFDEGNYLELKE